MEVEANSTDNPEVTPVVEPTETAEDAPVVEDLEKSIEAGLAEGTDPAPAPEETPAPDLSGQPAVPEPDYLGDLSGKFGDFGDPANVAKMAKAYSHLEGKMGEMGNQLNGYDEMRGKLEAVQEQLNRGTQQEAPEQDYWAEHAKNPLSQIPDPVLKQEEYSTWLEKTFMPNFQYRPVETMQHFMAPQLKQMYDGFMAELERYKGDVSFKENFGSFWGSKQEWSGDKTVGETFDSWGKDAETQYNTLVQRMGHEDALRMMALERRVSPLQAQAQESAAKEQAVAALASGMSSRGATTGDPQNDVGEGATIEERIIDAYKKKGVDIGGASQAVHKMG